MPKYNPNSIWGSKKKPINYQPPSKQTPPAQRAPSPAELARDAADMEPPKSHAPLWFFIVFFVVLAGGGALYFFFLRPAAGPSVSIEFVKPDNILVGDPFPLSIALTNYSSNILKGATLSIMLPDNISFVGQSLGQRVMEQVIGDLGPGSIYKFNGDSSPNLIVTGDPKSVKHINAKLTYSTDAASKTHFETDGGVDLMVGIPAITLTINPPSNIFSGQNFDVVVTYTNGTAHSFPNVELTVQYPPAFSFARSSMPPDNTGKNSWNLGTIPAAGSGSFTITGNVVGPDKAIYVFDGSLVGAVKGNTYTLTEGTGSLAIGTSPLALAITLNNASDYVADLSDTLNYVLTYTNNSNTTFQNISLKAALIGDMFNFSTLQTQGSFNSLTNTVTWNAANVLQLLNLAPGQSGSVNLQVRTKSAYPIRSLGDKNFTLKMNAQISSPTVPPGTQASSTISAVSAENKVGGKISLSVPAYWRDAASGVLNSGPYPPKVNQTTQYTIHWAITNYSTDVENVTVSASLQSGTTCTGIVKSNVSAVPACNAATGLVTWTIPTNIPATTGITGPPAEAVFQVQNTPAINQTGNAVTLLGPTTLQATDVFTGAAYKISADAITTDLPNDKTISNSQNRRVTQ
ncbi:MAG: hypothetical protein ABSC29_03985 [Minisyncoccia bacterium]|jgi:hypothetical protein